jgi:hypothetical protein
MKAHAGYANYRHETHMLIETPLLISGSRAATRVDPTSRATKGACNRAWQHEELLHSCEHEDECEHRIHWSRRVHTLPVLISRSHTMSIQVAHGCAGAQCSQTYHCLQTGIRVRSRRWWAHTYGSLSSGGNAAGKHCRTAKLRSPVGYVTSAARTASTFISIAVMENHHSTTWRAEQGPTQHSR